MSERHRVERGVERGRGLEELASAVADGDAVDWGDARLRLEGSEEDLEALRTLEDVARVFREADESTPTGKRETPWKWGHLEVREAIGEGSFGEVYRAHDPQLGRDVALKLRKPAAPGGREWLEEARRLARIRHENVLAVHGADRHDGREGIWSDWLDGQTLRERLEHDGPLGAAELVDVGATLARALAAIHAADLVHGDVKASNAMREVGGRIVLLDFGSGHELDDAGRVGSGVVQGSPLTTAPEVLEGGDPSASSDIYSLCAMLYLLATGEQPFDTNDLIELRQLAADGAFVPLRDRRADLPGSLVTTIESGLAPDASQRPASAGDLERRLLTVEDAANRGPEPKPGRLAAALSLAALIVLTFVWWSLSGDSREGVASAGPVNDRSDASASSPSPAALNRETATGLSADPGAERTAIGDARLLLVGPPDVLLETGSRIRPGDRLGLEVTASAETHLYVINEDQAGDLFVLFPLPGVEPSNPLAEGTHRLPGTIAGVEQSWVVTSAGGSESFLMVASRGPVELLESFIRRHRTAGAVEVDAGVESAAQSGPTVRGVGGLAPAPEGDSELATLFDQLAADASPTDLWQKVIRLDNPR